MHTPLSIAVVGMDGIFPGAPDLDRFWLNIVDGRDQSAPVPQHRWIAPVADRLRESLEADRTYSQYACLIDDFQFDPHGYRLDPNLTRQLDPVHQLTLMAGRRAVDGVVTGPVDPARVDTILAAIALPTDGASAFSREILGAAVEQRLFASDAVPAVKIGFAQALASRVDGLPAALLAAEMGFGGDSYTLDAACASSIYAVKLACDALIAHRADMVVTGGVSRPECLYTQTGFSQLGALSASGRCAPFDRQADGLVVGEGVGILILKRLEDALAHGDTVHGVIRGIGLTNDMRGNLLAPESRGQVRAMGQAYRAANWVPSDVELIECHGTGTRAGDTTEIESLVELWQGETAGRSCAIGSVKSMIGHLLTAAGAAGMIKTLLAMRHHTLPPSINFTTAPADSPLENSPFHVQTAPAEWPLRESGRPRRTAVSAFGFGGINAHLLVEEWITDERADAAKMQTPITVGERRPTASATPMAIVGMDLTVGAATGLHAFTCCLFDGDSLIGGLPEGRWKGADPAIRAALDGKCPGGAYMGGIDVGVGEFQIPPSEIDAILPQQLLALKVGAGALRDAGLPLRQSRERMGVVFGIAFDFEATNFHMRWQLPAAMQRWERQYGFSAGPDGGDFLERLREQCGPPLTPPRVLGALGGIVASRMAREFRFGGPSFVVSADAASGIKALQVAVDLLHSGDVDAMLVGGVDLAGDGRSVVRLDRMMPLSPTNTVRPLDARADGCLPGDGAVALVLKRLDRAQQDQDRIYAIVRGIGTAGGEGPDSGGVAEASYGRSLARCFQQSGADAASISYVETDGSAVPSRDRVELNALGAYFGDKKRRQAAGAVALGATSPFCGHTGAAHGLMGLAKTALCLHHRTLPPLPGFKRLPDALTGPRPFHLPHRSQPWYRDRQDGPRTACVATVTVDGGCSHVLLEDVPVDKQPAARIGHLPTAGGRHGRLVVISGDSRQAIDAQLALLDTHLQGAMQAGSRGDEISRWMAAHLPEDAHRLAVSLIIEPDRNPKDVIDEARRMVLAGSDHPPSRQVFFRSRPMGPDAKIAMVYPGSGNHYLAMGRDLANGFPDIVERMDADTARLKTQWRPWHLMPWRQDWGRGWESDAAVRLSADPLNMIFGQVVFGGLMTGILDRFGIRPNGIIGYSLGESAALFANGIWADRGDMLDRMEATDLFTTQLAGPCQSLRQAWNVDPDDSAEWRVAVVNRPAGQVKTVLKAIAGTRLLIVNTPDECVIGGLAPAVKEAIAALGCQAVYLDGVVTVHCDAARPVADAYRQLHHFATAPNKGFEVYSCSWARAYSVTSEKIADSIKKQAVDGFDFTQTIRQAFADGYRVFVEAGPRASCTRMIGRILHNEPHLAVSASHGSGNEIDSLLRCLARLAAERVPLDLSVLYQQDDRAAAVKMDGPNAVHVTVGGAPMTPTLSHMSMDASPFADAKSVAAPAPPPSPSIPSASPATADRLSGAVGSHLPPATQMERLLEAARENIDATAEAHRQFLELSRELTQAYADAFDLQNSLLKQGARPAAESVMPAAATAFAPQTPSVPLPAFDRRMCMEFAVGSVGRMLGPAFDVVDTHRVRVRLPDEPLMLVDRILQVEGEMLSMTSGRVVTEHDVLPGAWYLDGDRAPVCISVEAGQADLFLSAYLGIDHQVNGERAYRLLDAEVTFHRGLPRPGDTIRYDIAIDRFVRQGDTWMFFFRFEGSIGGQPLISMRDGCAGFFTEAEVANSGGVILTEAERQPAEGTRPPDWTPPVPMVRETYDDRQVDALRRGDLAGCFGPAFDGIDLADSLRLPDDRMRLIHRILELDPAGGRYGLGSIRAEADIRPDDWFLTCHFVDDMVMPGTLMYECCAHTLRVFVQRMGWVTDKDGVCYEPVIGNAARLKCRGPVTPSTRNVHYEIHISEIGYGPEPYVIADAHMFADGHPIVFFKNMSMKMTGIDRQGIEAAWKERSEPTVDPPPVRPLYDHASILAFATGKPSDAFGEPYRVFDSRRRIARLPGPPYCFMDRVVQVEPEPWTLAPGGWITAQYAVPSEEWYFAADRSGVMPFCVLLEIALQPCGWLAAYAGSALRSQRDLKFRNLGGSAVLHRQIGPDAGMLTMRSRLTKVSEAADMIIEHFDFEVLAGREPVYTGDTYFGFFSAEALGQQKGLGGADPMVAAMAPYAARTEGGRLLAVESPRTPDAALGRPLDADGLKLPGKALLMIDRIDALVVDGGPHGLGYIRGAKTVDPKEWFFKAHFYQDPVCPGSLGLESFLQLLKTVAMKRWPQLAASHRFRLLTGARHTWSYRGQIIPDNAEVSVEAVITHIAEGEAPVIRADGLLSVDGLPIYKMQNFEMALVPAAQDSG